jgi:hypothetical protein
MNGLLTEINEFLDRERRRIELGVSFYMFVNISE